MSRCPTLSIHLLRGEEDEAYCAVCGDGSSVEPNMIVFCERCDLAVHQNCYGIGEIPQGVGR